MRRGWGECLKQIDVIRAKSSEELADIFIRAFQLGAKKPVTENTKERLITSLEQEIEPSGKKGRKLTMKIMLEKGATMPTRAHPTDAGLDLYSKEEVTLLPRGAKGIDSFGTLIDISIGEVFDTGVHIKLPPGTYARVEGRSGLNMNHDIVVCGGTIDEPYTGSIKVKLYNLGTEPYTVHVGDRIAQLVIVPCLQPELELVDSLEETDRGESGIGSTGK